MSESFIRNDLILLNDMVLLNHKSCLFCFHHAFTVTLFLPHFQRNPPLFFLRILYHFLGSSEFRLSLNFQAACCHETETLVT